MSGTYTPKKLIVCCDGTWKDSDSSAFLGTGVSWLWRGKRQVATNVTKISQAILPLDDQGRQQIIYYQAGVGTSGNFIERTVGGALGVGLAPNISEAYSFVSSNYVEGDEIYLIGFSRGAFTARAIGGIIGDFGLLTSTGQGYLPAIVEDWEHAGQTGYNTELANELPGFTIPSASTSDPKSYVKQYRAELLRIGLTRDATIPIKAIGVWETVGSLGIPVSPWFQRIGFPLVLRFYRFYNTDLGSNVENAFQALALDEKRAAYRPTLWQKLPGMQANLKQTWFPGVHSNVGGGYLDSGLSNNTLAWMMSNLAPFLKFDADFVRRQYEQNQARLEKQSVAQAALKWAAGQLKNTSSGLRGLLGVTVRTPGRYHVLNKKSLTVTEGDPLQDTNEHIHVSARSREITGGLNEKDRLVAYKPKALRRSEYELLDPHAEPGKAAWRYVGREKQFRDEVLPEDELGVFEKEIFRDYVTKART
ncbi:hypothetical protein EJ03DRAFT_352209 [Teratosphaeria nubilosa]|uniref:T6SS Phospholipase effector Tle1-like catalytic domain-containing protein n=1 Tax=Teratosphaeria nubilosa TaxID=161662 RepID=A0A6G1L6D1_9PEZI|nr:hypothetical protein EJ03DRAFT_352209 [Teratosphaeria nubilosa]